MLELVQLVESRTQKIQALLHQGRFREVIKSCESQISFPVSIPTEIHWLYGLALLLNGQEEDAQSTWMMAMMEGDEEQVASWLRNLVETLDQNAVFQEEQGNLPLADLIRHHSREILPDDYRNLLKLIKLKLLQGTLTLDSFAEFEIVELLTSEVSNKTFSDYPELILEILELYLKIAFADEITAKFVAAIQPYLKAETFIVIVYTAATKIGHFRRIPKLALELLELCFDLEPEDLDVLVQMAEMLLAIQSNDKAIELGRKISSSTTDPITQLIGSYYILKAHLREGKTREATLKAAQEHEVYLKTLISSQPDVPYSEARHLISAVHLLTYINDNPRQHRVIQNQIIELCEKSIRLFWEESHDHYTRKYSSDSHEGLANQQHTDRPLKIGYICSCFYNHSVGWLARTLIQHHNIEKFEIYIYAVNTPPPGSHPVRDFYQRVTPNYRVCGFVSGEIADQIHTDQIDILIDLDSITRDTVCAVMALKPAPIQATWMGWDAVGMSSIDYYIADNYALPDNAQDYYVEKIWRLPQTFLSVDGFEVGIPTVSRHDLNIPEDAIVFLNPQQGFKLTPEVLELQLKILKATPNSYLLLKGIADQETLQRSLGQLAQDVGVSLNRLRPIPYAPSEEIHRANLAIADIILDTFPYNGATTTMEALWMERPIVTLVGQQFSARNSYTMMMNAGITEGISWTPEEYVAWGIRLGTEPELRQQVAWKLRQGKQAAPLWNGKAFAQQMEAAYTEMYQIYVDRIDVERTAAQPN